MTALAPRVPGAERAPGAQLPRAPSLESVAAVREALAVTLTSAYLLRRRLRDVGAVDDYLQKHLSRIEESVGRAELALMLEAKAT